MSAGFSTISPVDGKVILSREYATPSQIEQKIALGAKAYRTWRQTPLNERIEAIDAFVAALIANKEKRAEELTLQMGRPLSQTPWEIDGFASRAKSLISQAPDALADMQAPTPLSGFNRFIRRDPLGICLILSPWNYPYLTAVNALVAALLSGNVVVLKHAEQTPLCAEALNEAANRAGLPEGVFQYLHASHDQIGSLIRDSRIAHVAFTGSLKGGRAIKRAAVERFIPMGFELGGNDAAYVRHDANFDHAVSNLTEGAMFNSGQSCCGIERIYVHKSLYKAFTEAVRAETLRYRFGDPRDLGINLGPMVRAQAANHLKKQIKAAISGGAKALIPPTAFEQLGGAYHPPQILVDVNPSMAIQCEESFGPVVTITPVDSDEDAIAAINASDLGLTSAIWTTDPKAAIAMGDRLETGTVFMNRCDFLDPELPWTGIKNSGLGCTLSSLGIQAFTQPKSFHLRTTL